MVGLLDGLTGQVQRYARRKKGKLYKMNVQRSDLSDENVWCHTWNTVSKSWSIRAYVPHEAIVLYLSALGRGEAKILYKEKFIAVRRADLASVPVFK